MKWDVLEVFFLIDFIVNEWISVQIDGCIFEEFRHRRDVMFRTWSTMVNYGKLNRLGFLMLGAFLLSKVRHSNWHFHSINKEIMENHIVFIIKGGHLEKNLLNEFGS